MQRHKRKSATWHVVRGENGWVVKRSAPNSETAVYETQAEAIEAARGLLRRSGGELRTEGRDGRFRDSFTVGREPFKKISSIEGILPSSDTEKDFDEFDRRGLSADQRREAITRKFRGKG